VDEDPVVPMRMSEIREHEEHVNGQFAAKERELAAARQRVAELEGDNRQLSAAVSFGVRMLRQPRTETDVDVVLDRLKEVL
jgi:hypothetical protein